MEFVGRYIKETEQYLLPIAQEVNHYMVIELNDLIKSRTKYRDDIIKLEEYTYKYATEG